jgi:diguanylate cyclase (GGDEF)-like protein
MSALSRDGKTGVLTDRAWRHQAHCTLRRSEHPYGLLVLDLDHFKAVNDTHGYLAGDEVLAAVARAIGGAVRAHDVVGRFGGEEFVVLITDLAANSAVATVAERIRRHIAALSVEITTLNGPKTVTGLTASIGGACYPDHGPGLDTLLLVADAHCYTAKAAGRNTVRIAGPLPASIRAGTW